MRLAELCAGYGGLHLSLLAAGWPVELAWYAETDPDAAAVMAAHHPGVPNVGDVTTAEWSACEPVDIIAAGYPCQPFSVAGRMRGTEDERWIWPDIARAIRALRPRVVLLENVPGHLARGASRVVADLAASGYVGSWCCVRASDVGAPHRRERLFILARPADSSGEQVGAAGHAWAGAGRAAADADGAAVRQQPVAVAGGGGAAVAGVAGTGPVELLPTPTARDHKGRNQRGDATCLPGALLPTPRASDGEKGGPNQRDSHGNPMLSAAVQPGRWGRYDAAIARWERVTGRPAPEPTQPGTRGQPRLSPLFVEWLMGLPAGHVTDHVGRSAALRILGNGVVPQQGAHAIRLLAHVTEGVHS